MSTLGTAAILSLKIYLLAIAISMTVALGIRLIGMVTSMAGGASRGADQARADTVDASAAAHDDIAAIAAAVRAVLGAHRIVHIEERGRGHAWRASGRSAHHASHDVSRHPQPPVAPQPKR